jgi:hypothetical protein
MSVADDGLPGDGAASVFKDDAAWPDHAFRQVFLTRCSGWPSGESRDLADARASSSSFFSRRGMIIVLLTILNNTAEDYDAQDEEHHLVTVVHDTLLFQWISPEKPHQNFKK